MMETVNVLLQIKFKLRIDQVHRQIVTALLNPVQHLQISFFFSPFKIWGRRLSETYFLGKQFFMLPNDVSSVILLRQSTKQYGRGLVCGELTLVLIMNSIMKKKRIIYFLYL